MLHYIVCFSYVIYPLFLILAYTRIYSKLIGGLYRNHDLPIKRNILNRQFKVSQPNKVWVSDITYIYTKEGWLYLAIIIDLYGRKVVGWSMNERITKELVLEALEMAINRRKPARGLIFHSDRGSQYASHEFQRMLWEHGFISSMSRKGNCWDNAVSESFFQL